MKRISWIQIRIALAVLCSFAGLHTVFAQDWAKQLSSDDSAALNAIVLYPDSIRNDIFEACTHPELIVRIANLQDRTSASFADLIAGKTTSEQEDIWDLTRYPDLISKIGGETKLSKGALTDVADGYPDDIRAKITEYGRDDYDLLHQIKMLQDQSNNEFSGMLNTYPDKTIQAFRDIVQLPELMTLLNDHLQLSVLVGDIYRRDPQQCRHMADSLNIIVAEQNAANAADWKKSIESDTAAQNDLKAAAESYAQDNGYTSEDYSVAPSQYYIDHYVCYPYPYWFGYPYWYPYNYFYPYPWWYDWGFYYDAFGNMVIIGPPSYYFTYWYFYYPVHYYHHPHLAVIYINHYYYGYYGPRLNGDGNTNIVRHWVSDNKDALPEGFLNDSRKVDKVEAIRELGKMGTDLQQYNQAHPAQTVSRDAYLKDNHSEYPSLNVPSRSEVNLENGRPGMQQEQIPPVKQPPVKVPTSSQNKGIQTQPPGNFNKEKNAIDYHKYQWDRQQPVPNQNRTPVIKSQPNKRGNKVH